MSQQIIGSTFFLRITKLFVSICWFGIEALGGCGWDHGINEFGTGLLPALAFFGENILRFFTEIYDQNFDWISTKLAKTTREKKQRRQRQREQPQRLQWQQDNDNEDKNNEDNKDNNKDDNDNKDNDNENNENKDNENKDNNSKDNDKEDNYNKDSNNEDMNNEDNKKKKTKKLGRQGSFALCASKGYILTKKPWYCLVFGNFHHHN